MDFFYNNCVYICSPGLCILLVCAEVIAMLTALSSTLFVALRSGQDPEAGEDHEVQNSLLAVSLHPRYPG